MKNTWKGLVVGALTGMLGGVVLDAAVRTRQEASRVIDKAVERAPGIAERVPDAAAAVAHRTAEAVRDADLGGKVRDMAQRVGGAGDDA